MKRLGPELKMPDLKKLKGLKASKGLKAPTGLKPPAYLADVYYDLRDRRLLPLVALVAVAIVAVPFLLGGDAETPAAPPPEEAAAAALEEEEAGSSDLTVVEANPGLRDYRKRLRRRTPTDPFKQRYTSIPREAQLSSTVASSEVEVGGGGSSETSVTEVEETVTEVEEQGSAPAGPTRPDPPRSSAPKNRSSDVDGRRFFGFRPDVRFGVAGSGELATHEDLPLGSLLPKRAPVLLFVGVTQDGKRAFFSLTRSVTHVRGNGGCVGGKRDCRILSLKVGQAVDLLTGSDGRGFRLKVMRIDLVELDLPTKKQGATGSRVDDSRRGWAREMSQSFSK